MVIVGGGAVGVELSGEIAAKYPENHLTIVHSGNALVTSNFGGKLPLTIKSQLNQSRRINPVLGVRQQRKNSNKAG